jgi:sugar transferase (PEP-CTERM system associated)
MLRFISRYLAFRRLGSVMIESILLVICVVGAVHIRLHTYVQTPREYLPLIPRALVMVLVFQLFLHLRDVYDYSKSTSRLDFTLRLMQALVLATAALTFLYYLIPDLMMGRGVFLVSLLLVSAFLVVWHSLLRLYIGMRTPNTRLLILGTGRLARELTAEILEHPELGLKVCGFVDSDPEMTGQSVVNPTVLGMPCDLQEIAAAYQVDRIIVELQDRRGRLPVDDLLNLKMKGTTIEDATSLYERVAGKIAIENLKPSWLIFNGGFQVSRRLLLQKRLLSLAASSVLLILFAPVMLLAMALIKLDTRGPLFYRQERVGQDGRVFVLWKFRSMRADAEEGTGPVWSRPDDDRVTRIGRLLRRTRLDELPQLFNVLKGDMSLVGPRPERPHFVKELSNLIPFYPLRHSVKPGVTGWAQIKYEYGNSVRDAVEKLQYDLFYIKHMSWLLDSLIIFETIKTVLVRRGS